MKLPLFGFMLVLAAFLNLIPPMPSAYSYEAQAAGMSHLSGNVKDDLKPIWRLGHAAINNAAWSANGELVAVTESLGIEIFHTENLENPLKHLQSTENIQDAQFSADNQWLAARTDEGKLYVWHLSDWNVQSAGFGNVVAFAFSPKTAVLVYATADGLVQLWDIGSTTETMLLDGHVGAIRHIVLNFDGQLLAILSDKPSIDIWSTVSKRRFTSIKGTHQFVALAFSPRDNTLVSSDAAPSIKRWNVLTGQLIATQSTRDYLAEIIAFKPDGTSIAVGDNNGVIRVRELTSGLIQRTLLGHGSTIKNLQWTTKNQLLSTSTGEVRFWELRNGEQKAVFKHYPNDVYDIAFSPDGKLIAAGSFNQTIRLWAVDTGVQYAEFDAHEIRNYSIAFSPDNLYLAAAGASGVIHLWTIADGQEVMTLEGHSERINQILFSPDGQRLISASADRSIRFWNLKTQRMEKVLQGHPQLVSSIAISPDGHSLVSASTDGMIRLWNVEDSQQITTVKSHSGVINSVEYASDGSFIVSAGEDATLRLWNMPTVEPSVRWGHDASILRAAVSPDNQWIASSSVDKTVRIWHRDRGQEEFILKGHSSPVQSVAFSPDGKLLASSSSDSTIAIWALP